MAAHLKKRVYEEFTKVVQVSSRGERAGAGADGREANRCQRRRSGPRPRGFPRGVFALWRRAHWCACAIGAGSLVCMRSQAELIGARARLGRAHWCA